MLMVCLGNICRSPAAQAVLQRTLTTSLNSYLGAISVQDLLDSRENGQSENELIATALRREADKLTK